MGETAIVERTAVVRHVGVTSPHKTHKRNEATKNVPTDQTHTLILSIAPPSPTGPIMTANSEYRLLKLNSVQPSACESGAYSYFRKITARDLTYAFHRRPDREYDRGRDDRGKIGASRRAAVRR